jgi:uncharacterized protein (TIGR02598 family)
MSGREDGFSLIEVTLAMGIVATVLVSLLALLPYGMDQVREAKSTMVQSRIANEIVGELQVADWGKEPNYKKMMENDGEIRRYDSEGTLMKDSKDQNKTNVVYKARIEIPNEPSHLPGQQGRREGRYLRRVTVKVAYAPGDMEVDFQSKKVPPPFRSFTTEIVKLARDEIR